MTARQRVSEAMTWRWGELMYVEDGDGRALPAWAEWLIGLGDWLASCPRSDRVARIVISVPTRRFVGALAAVGIVAGVASKDSSRDPYEHLARLASLSPNTPVRYRAGNSNKLKSARFDGIVLERGEEYVRLTGGYKRVSSQCAYIEPLPLDCEPFIRDREICEKPHFIEAVTGQDAVFYAFPQQVECTIVGTKSTIREEFSLPLRIKHLDAELQDLARPAEMQQHPADGYRSRIVSASLDAKIDGLGDPAGAVILDGPAAILRWRHVARTYPWLAIIDRTSSSAIPAWSALASERASSIDDLQPPVSEPPPGIEMLCYVEAAA